jgi:hypothetical protein
MRVRFNFPLRRSELAALRGALVAHAGREHDRLHNHEPGGRKSLYRYPLVQYRVEGGFGALFCLGAGTEDMRHLLGGEPTNLSLNGKQVKLEVRDIAIDYFQPAISKRMIDYTVRSYLPLNQRHEATFKTLDDYARGDYLSRLLISHLMAFASGIDWHVPDRIRVELAGVRRLDAVSYKGTSRYAFDVRFRCNLDLPGGIALGKAVAMGFGVVEREDFKQNNL